MTEAEIGWIIIGGAVAYTATGFRIFEKSRDKFGWVRARRYHEQLCEDKTKEGFELPHDCLGRELVSREGYVRVLAAVFWLPLLPVTAVHKWRHWEKHDRRLAYRIEQKERSLGMDDSRHLHSLGQPAASGDALGGEH